MFAQARPTEAPNIAPNLNYEFELRMMEGAGREKPLEKLAALSGAGERGGFPRGLSESQVFAQRKMVEFRSGRVRLRSCGFFEAVLPHRSRLSNAKF